MHVRGAVTYMLATLCFAGCKHYSTAVDMWSVGIIMAELLLGKVPCMGKSELDQASKIWELVGTPNEENWPSVTKDTKIGQVGLPYLLTREHKPCSHLHAQRGQLADSQEGHQNRPGMFPLLAHILCSASVCRLGCLQPQAGIHIHINVESAS